MKDWRLFQLSTTSRRTWKKEKAMSKAVWAVVINPDNTFEHRRLEELSQYQEIVGGLIEAVRLYDYTYDNDVATFYVREDGWDKELPMNIIAGGISHLLNNEDMLYGKAILVGKADENGYDSDAPQWLIDFLKRVAKEVE
jgi:hypothetical protein